MTMFSSGDVVVIGFPFTDLSRHKQRPAIVVNSEVYATRYGDYVFMPLTSVHQADENTSIQYWKEAGLLKPSWLKPLLFTLSESIAVKRIGKLHDEDIPAVIDMIRCMIDARFRISETGCAGGA